MENFSDNGFDFFVHEDVLRLRQKFEIRKTAKRIGIAYLLLTFIPELVVLGVMKLDELTRAGLLTFFGSDPIGMHFFQIVTALVIFTLPFILMVSSSKMKLTEAISFSRPKNKTVLPFVLMGLGFCAFANICTNTLGSFFEIFGMTFTQPQYEDPTGAWGLLIVFLSVAVTPALTEEFAMRGAVIGVAKKHGEAFAVLISSILFGLMHGNFVQIPFAFVVGIALGYAVIKSGSIWTGILIHFLNNFFSVTLDYALGFVSGSVGNVVVMIYFALCFICFFVGLMLMKDKIEWRLCENEGPMTLRQKLAAFFTSPYIIICTLVSLMNGIGYIVFI